MELEIYNNINKQIRIKVIKSILYHSNIFNNKILPIDHFTNDIDDNLINQLNKSKLPDLIELKNNTYHQSIYPDIQIWTLSWNYIFLMRIVRRLYNLYNKSQPLKIWTNLFKQLGKIQVFDTDTKIGSIYIFITDSDYYNNLEFYKQLKNQLKRNFIITEGRLYLCIKSINQFSYNILS